MIQWKIKKNGKKKETKYEVMQKDEIRNENKRLKKSLQKKKKIFKKS